MAQRAPKLLVASLDGTPRSGKGTIAEHLASTEPMATHYETGIRYRTVAYMLCETGVIEPDMTPEKISSVVGAIDTQRIAELSGQTARIREEVGKDALYTAEVDTIVPSVGGCPNVRPAIKDRLNTEIERAVDSPFTQLMVLDGRRLQDVARKVAGVEVVLNLFVRCSEETAASREVARERMRRFQMGRKPMSDAEEEAMHSERVAQLRERRRKDEERADDPVVAEEGAMSYWHNTDFIERTIADYAELYGISRSAVRRSFEGGDQNFFRYARLGAGAVAFVNGKAQIIYDSNSRNLEEMCGDARLMLREARLAASGQ